MPSRALDPRRSAVLSIALVALIWLLTLAYLDLHGLWITDNENKFLQVRAILASGFSDFSLPWLGREIDPQLALNPIPAPFSHVQDGRIWSQYPPAFAALSALPFRWWSFPGLYVLPWLGAVLSLIAVARLTRLTGIGPAGVHVSVLLAGLCTPLWFYAVVFWEHSLALALFLFGLHCALRQADSGSGRDAAFAGVLAAFGVWLRDEMILIGVLLVLLVWLDARSRRWPAAAITAGAFAAGLALLFLFQSVTIDSPLGYHLQSNLSDLGAHLRSRPAVFYRLFLAAGPRWLPSIAITGPFVVGLMWLPRIRTARSRAALILISGIASIVGLAALAGYFESPRGPIAHLLRANSLFPAAPFLLFSFWRLEHTTAVPDAGRAALRLRQVALAYAILYGLLAPAISAQGVHWGNRYLLPLYPLLTVLAVRNILPALGTPRTARALIASMSCAAAVSFLAQLYSIHLLQQKTDFSRRVNQELAARTEPVVVTDQWWVPQALFAVLDAKPVFLVRSREQIEQLEAELRARGLLRFAWVTSAIGREPQPGERTIDDGGLRFFSVAVSSRTLSP